MQFANLLSGLREVQEPHALPLFPPTPPSYLPAAFLSAASAFPFAALGLGAACAPTPAFSVDALLRSASVTPTSISTTSTNMYNSTLLKARDDFKQARPKRGQYR